MSPAKPEAARGCVALDVGRIDENQPLLACQDFTLTVIGVRNPGAVTSMYVMGV